MHAESLVEQLDEVNTIVCDKGYESEPFRTFVKARIQVRSATVRHLSSHTHFFEYDGWLPKA